MGVLSRKFMGLVGALALAGVALGQGAGPSDDKVRIVDGEGRPVAGASVLRLRSHDLDLSKDAEFGPVVRLKTTTDANGVASTAVDDLACLLAFKGDLAGFRCGAVPPEGLRLVKAVRLRVRLAPAAGEAPRDPRVRLYFPGGDCRHGIDPVVAKDGVLEFPPLPAEVTGPERMQLELSAPGWWGGPYAVPEPREDGVTVVPVTRARSLRGRVVDPKGNPVAGAKVWTGNPGDPQQMDGIETDAKGAFAIAGVPTVAGVAFVRTGRFAPARIDLAAGTTDIDAGRITLKVGVPLEARVVEEDGAVVQQFAVFVEDAQGYRIEVAEELALGRFRTGPLDAAPTKITGFVHKSEGIVGSRYFSAELVPGRADQVLRVPSGLRIRLTDADGKPRTVDSATVTLRRPGGRGETETYEGSFREIRKRVIAEAALEVAVTTTDGSKGSGSVTTDAEGRGEVEIRLVGGR